MSSVRVCFFYHVVQLGPSNVFCFLQYGLYFLILNYLLIYGIYGGIDALIYARFERWMRKQLTAAFKI